MIFYILSQISQISQIFAASSISDISVISCVPLVASEQNSSAVEPKFLQGEINLCNLCNL